MSEVNFKTRLIAAEKAFLDVLNELGPCRAALIARDKVKEARLIALDYAERDAADDDD